MASEKYHNLAVKYLAEETERLATWLETNVNAWRKEHGEDVIITLTRNNSFNIGDEEPYPYASISFEMNHGSSIL